MILLALIGIWLVLITFFVALCRVAAAADARTDAATQRYPTVSAKQPRAEVPGLLLGEGRLAPAPREEPAKARDARGRGERYAAGS